MNDLHGSIMTVLTIKTQARVDNVYSCMTAVNARMSTEEMIVYAWVHRARFSL